jgi:glycosyltransferase involved in cell wall biosynthesis
MKTVSVLVTFYNQEEYIERALTSIIEQKVNFDYEIIIGDDGSSDHSPEHYQKWIERYPDKIRLITNSREGECIPSFRASWNRIGLLKEAGGKYFIFLDGDDYFSDASKLQKQVDILENRANSDCVACGHNIEMLYKDGSRSLATDSSLQEGKLTAKEYWKRYYIHTDTLLIRSSVINQLPLKLLENNFNDNLITFSVIQFGDIYYLPEPMAVYLQTEHGIWTYGDRANNLIRNIMGFDLCIQINRQMYHESVIRFAQNWNELIKIRKQIDAEKLGGLLETARDKNMDNTISWITYNQLSIYGKISLITGCLWKDVRVALHILHEKINRRKELER